MKEKDMLGNLGSLFGAGQPQPGPPTATAGSVVFDIADNWGQANFTAVRSIEFKINGATLPLVSADFSTNGTSALNSSYLIEFAFDTSLSKTGHNAGTQWHSVNGGTSNQRLIIAFDTPQTFDEIVVNNGHQNGGFTDWGARNVKITVSPNDEFFNTTYDAAISGGTVLNDTEWPQHTGSDVVDDQTVWTFGS